MADLIIIGGGSHAKVVADIAMLNGYKLLGFLDDNPNAEGFFGYKRLGSISDCLTFENCTFCIALGNNGIRRKIAEQYDCLEYATLIHPGAFIGSNVNIEKGTVVMPGAVINACAQVGRHCVINSCAVVEHDSVIGDFSFMAPNSTVCGLTNIGCNCWIGAGSTVNNVLTVCDNVTVGSGAAVVKNITEAGVYVGVPAKPIKK